jgi:hypothetical protein
MGLPFTTPGITYQQALAKQFTSVPGGVVSAAPSAESPTRHYLQKPGLDDPGAVCERLLCGATPWWAGTE